VARYTLRFFDEAHEPDGSEDLECASDGEAINAVNDRAETRAVELWLGARKILWWPARRPRPAARRRSGGGTPFQS
jgi:hypothetical protein